ncbi:MAG: site-2 protease family protein [Limnochordaceae bacterium]|nr:site-2 protease family protein [Limnochordaceae bacterium]
MDGSQLNLLPNGAQIALSLTALLLSVILHEIAHGWVALLRGDYTAKSAGRLSLNPLVHLDPIGSVLLPLLLVLSHSPAVFGWAKPVPVNPANLYRPRQDDRLVALAGPATNLLLGLAAIVILLLLGLGSKLILAPERGVILGLPLLLQPTILVSSFPGDVFLQVLVQFLKDMVLINFVLALFNLIPIPPLDGFHVVWSVLPERLLPKLQSVWQLGWLLFLVLIYTGATDFIIRPGLVAAQWLLLRGAAWIGLF